MSKDEDYLVTYRLAMESKAVRFKSDSVTIWEPSLLRAAALEYAYSQGWRPTKPWCLDGTCATCRSGEPCH